jgi:DNA-binding transcriptional LysR family regulator
MSRVVRLAGFTEAMREHVPVLLAKLRERFPGLKVTLQEIDQRGAEQLIAQGDADLAMMVLESSSRRFSLCNLGAPSALPPSVG